MSDYSETISFWDEIFTKEQGRKFTEATKLINRDLEECVFFLSENSKSILDYGCGSGSLLMKCGVNKKVERCMGIDISPEAVELCRKTATLSNLQEKVEFICGDISSLEKIGDNSFQGAILSNIIDNVTPEDCDRIIENIGRILVPEGLLLVKLNSYIEEGKLREYGAELVGENFYREKEGIYLRNLETHVWNDLIEKYFYIESFREIYYKEFDQYNRLYMVRNKKEL